MSRPNPWRRPTKDLDRPQGASAWSGYVVGLLLLAGVFTLVANRFLWDLPPNASAAMLWFGSTLIVSVLFAVSGLFVAFGYILVSLLALVAALEWYVVSIGIRDPRILITDLMETDPRELLGFVDWPHLLVVLLAILGSVALVNLLWRLTPNILVASWLRLGRVGRLLAALLAIVAFIAGTLVKKPPIEEAQERLLQAGLWPVLSNLQTLRIMKGYYFGEQQFATRLATVPSAAQTPSTFADHPAGITVVFVFGESVRGDHWGLNGYRRNTTPYLAREAGVVNFPDAISFGTYTQVSAIGMMTPATFAEPYPKAGSFVDLFSKHGFQLGSFVSSRATSVQRKFIAPIKHQVAVRGVADGLLPEIRSFVVSGEGRNRFLFIYTEGNHFPYRRGYDEASARFKPDDHGRTHLEGDIDRLVNAYDNAVIYTDRFLASVLDLLRDRPAVLVYASDHGDALGDEGNFIRGGSMTSAYLRRVPMFIWMSDPFEAAFPEKASSLRAHAALSVSHENIFPTILSLAGISSPLIDPTLDLSDARARPRGFEVADGAPAGSRFHK